MISIAIPVHNAAATVRQTLDSVLAQTYADYEVVLVDDGSSDGSHELLLRFAEEHPNFRVFRNADNRGAAFSRNRAVREAEGEYVAFLDADDLWTPDKLEKQAAFAAAHPEYEIWFTSSGFLSPAGEKLDSVLRVPPEVDRKALLKQNVISCSSVMLRRETALEHPFPEQGRCHEDYAAWLSVLSGGGKAGGLDEPLLLYRLGTGKSANKIRAAAMNWRTYGAAGLSFPQKVRYMASYAFRSVRKYAGILIRR